MKRPQSRTVPDAFWVRVERLTPGRQRDCDQAYKRKPGGGRTPQGPRKVFEGILYVLRTGCPWEALPKGGVGGASAVHQCFLDWRAAGLFERPWRAGLLEYRELGGLPGNGKAWAARWPRHRRRWSRWAGTPPAGEKRQQQGPVG
ncbi:transposase [Methyloglobulus sp.]|uniref:transposase n=1 Tax=Methyloglobulus sp. TaxID=2518622 RepID=UPI003989B2FD